MAEGKHAFAITPDDGNDLPEVALKLYVDVGGDVVVTLSADTVSITLSVASNSFIDDLRIKKVHAAGTTATGLIGFN